MTIRKVPGSVATNRSLLGAGGMGEVYLADDLNLHRRVAIKVLPADFTADKDRLQRFEREAFTASSLNHPNILTIYEIGSKKDLSIATEFIDGESLGERLRRESFSVHEVSDVGIQIAAALAAAHAAGIVHRDIKPDNVMLRRDHVVKVLDFGLAKLSDQTSRCGDGRGDQSKASDDLGRRDWHGAPYVAGTGARSAGGCAHRHLELRGRAL